LVDLNDYKMLYQKKDRGFIKTWIFVLLILIIGIFYINNSFKYCKYYSSLGEYKDNSINIYVLINDLEKITKNNKINIKEEEFAYKIKQISKENIYMNNNYYKEVKLLVKDNKLVENEVVDIKIIIDSSSLFEYVFKTVWR